MLNRISFRWVERLDTLNHWAHKHLHVPMSRRLCDHYDWRMTRHLNTTSSTNQTWEAN